MTAQIEALRNELNQLNQRLAQLTGCEPVPLAHQEDASGADSLFLYGIIGGKDVGKTTLINQLAGAEISIDTDLLDEGTHTAVAYCHQDDLPALQHRMAGEFSKAGPAARIRYETHNRDVLRNVVLVDFPDFDSRFVDHRQDVQRLARYMQGLVWVVTPRKYGDHEFIDRLETVAQSNENYTIVMNKIDQLDGKVTLNTVRAEVLDYLEQECRRRAVPSPAPERLMLISAENTQRYDFERLHDHLIRVHSPEEIARAKAENIHSEFEKNIARLVNYYQINNKIESIEHQLEQLQREVNETFDQNYYECIWQRVQQMESLQRRIAYGVFLRRVEGWPILRQVGYPFAGIVAFMAGRFALNSAQPAQPQSVREMLRYQGQSAAARMQKLAQQIEPVLPATFELSLPVAQQPRQIEPQFAALLQRYEERVIELIKTSMRNPRRFTRLMVYLPLLWFPFLQPVLLHFVQQESFWLVLDPREWLPLLVRVLGAANLLNSLAFLLLFYFCWLLVIYARGARRVVNEGKVEFEQLWFDEFLPWVYQQLATPLNEWRTQWLECRSALANIKQQIEAELKSLSA